MGSALLQLSFAAASRHFLRARTLLQFVDFSTNASVLVLGINMNAVAEGLKFGAQYDLPGAVLLKGLKAAHLKGLEHNVAMPLNALFSTLLFDSMGEKPQAK
jgi:hypothetical protein